MRKKLKKIFLKISFIILFIALIFVILNKELSNDFIAYNIIWLNSDLYFIKGSQIAFFFTLIKSFNSGIEFISFCNLFLFLSVLNFLFFIFNLANLKKINLNFFNTNLNLFLFFYFFIFLFYEFFFIRLRTGLAIDFVILAINFFLIEKKFFKYFSIILFMFMSLFISYEVSFFTIYILVYIFLYKKKPKFTLIFNIIFLIFVLLQYNLIIYNNELYKEKIINFVRLILLGVIPFFIYLYNRFNFKFVYPNFLNIIFYQYFSFILVALILNYLNFIDTIGEKISRFISLYQFIFFFYLLKINNIKKSFILLYLLIIYNLLFIRAIFIL
jgi:hypothetical protein